MHWDSRDLQTRLIQYICFIVSPGEVKGHIGGGKADLKTSPSWACCLDGSYLLNCSTFKTDLKLKTQNFCFVLIEHLYTAGYKLLFNQYGNMKLFSSSLTMEVQYVQITLHYIHLWRTGYSLKKEF